MNRELVSYPKSGRSRLRFGLHTLGVETDVRFHHDGFEFNDGARPPHDFDPQKRIARIQEDDRVILLKRDPRDVLVSLYHQVTGRFQDFFHYTGTISDFVRDPYFGAESLGNFYRMWDVICAHRQVLVVTYEQCAADPVAVFQKVLHHYAFALGPKSAQDAAESSTFERMRELEESGSFERPWLRKRNGFAKVRQGKVGGYTEALPPEDIAYLDECFPTE